MTQSKEETREYKRKNREKHKEQGWCDNCREKATHGIYCIKHWKMAKIRNLKGVRKQVLKYRAEDRCIRCGSPLDLDADAGFVKCINCRESIGKVSFTISHRRYYDYNTVEESSHAGEL